MCTGLFEHLKQRRQQPPLALPHPGQLRRHKSLPAGKLLRFRRTALVRFQHNDGVEGRWTVNCARMLLQDTIRCRICYCLLLASAIAALPLSLPLPPPPPPPPPLPLPLLPLPPPLLPLPP